MITLEEILKKDESEYILLASTKERILANILEEIYNLAILEENLLGQATKNKSQDIYTKLLHTTKAAEINSAAF